MSQEVWGLLEKGTLTLAPISKRAVAFVIDDLLISLLFAIVYWDRFVLHVEMEQMVQAMNEAIYGIILVKILYQTFFVWMYGATLGKIAMKIRIVQTQTAEKPSFLVALNRSIFRVVGEMIFYLGFILAFFDKNAQALHDKTAGTVVINA